MAHRLHFENKLINGMATMGLATCLLFFLFIGGCSEFDTEETRIHRLLVWHSWPDPESELVETLLKNYTELFPNVHIVSEYVSLKDMQTHFEQQVQSGMGPDLFIGLDAHQLCRFVEQGYLHELMNTDFDTSHFSNRTLRAFSLNDALYGAPFSATTHVLYYNKKMGRKPLANLAQLIKQAEDGFRTGIPIDFSDAYWGVIAFNGSVFDEDYSIQTNQGFSAWMEWIQQALAQKNIIFDSNYEELRNLFANNQLDYFIGKSREFPLFHNKLGHESVGVATLPAGTNKTPGGFMEVETLAINQFSAEIDLAVNLINYLTNESSQRRIANGGLGRIPVNDDVHLNPRLSPNAAALRLQKRRAITLPITLGNTLKQLFQLGDDINQQVLQGILLPEEAADEFLIRNAELAEKQINNTSEAQ